MGISVVFDREKRIQEKKSDKGKLTGDDILLHTHQDTHTLLLDMGICLFEIVRESKCYNRQSGVVMCTGIIRATKYDFFRAFESEGPFATMNITDANVPPASL